MTHILREDNFSTFTQAKLIEIDRMDNSKSGNPNFKLKFEHQEGENTRVIYIYTEDDYSINNSICSNMLRKLFNVGVFVPHFHEYYAQNPNYRLSELFRLS